MPGNFGWKTYGKAIHFFCKSEFIEANLNSLLGKLAGENRLKELGVECFAQRSAYYMSELNMIHPFREGNGRAIREFIRCLALKSGLDIDWSLIDSKELLNATIIAVDNVLLPLEKCLYRVIVKVK